MRIQDVIDLVSSLDAVLVLQPRPGDGSPQIAWGDVFFYYAPDGVVPKTQPFATIVTKDYPGDDSCKLDRPGAFRVNIAAGAAEFQRRLGHTPKDRPAPSADPSRADILLAHPVYAAQAWLAVVNPGPQTAAAVAELIERAHEHARQRWHHRHPRPVQ